MHYKRRIVDLGTGPYGKHAVHLALDNPDAEVHGVDLHPKIDYKNYLTKDLKRVEIPQNLIVHPGTDVIDYLDGEDPSSFDEMHANFLLQHMTHAQRQRFMKLIMERLRPEGKLEVLEENLCRRQIPLELKSHELDVTTGVVRPEEMMGKGTDVSSRNATSSFLLENVLAKSYAKGKEGLDDIYRLVTSPLMLSKSNRPNSAVPEIKRTFPNGFKTREDAERGMRMMFRGLISDGLENQEDKPLSEEARKAIQLMSDDATKHIREPNFVHVVAVKPVKKVIQL